MSGAPGTQLRPSAAASSSSSSSSSSAAAAAHRRTPVQWAALGTGELLVTLGAVLLLFCVYQLVWTNVESAHATAQVARQLEDGWAHGSGLDFSAPEPAATVAPAVTAALKPGAALGFIHIPRLGADFRKPLIEGVDAAELARGVGHYPDTGLPGEIGNLALAGHRATHGEPFRYLDKLRKGDAVVIETRDRWLTYVVDGTETVLPSQVSVLLPVPDKPGRAATVPRLTLTTCTPRATSTHRLIFFATLRSTQPKADGLPAALRS